MIAIPDQTIICYAMCLYYKTTITTKHLLETTSFLNSKFFLANKFISIKYNGKYNGSTPMSCSVVIHHYVLLCCQHVYKMIQP